MDWLAGYKTVIVNVVLLIVQVAGVAAGSDLFIEYLPAIAIVQSVANLVLRAITTQPIFGKG